MGINAANGTPWAEVRRWMTEEFCPQSVLQRLEQELYNLKLKGTDIDGYTNRFHELALLCPRMVEPEQVKVEQYIRSGYQQKDRKPSQNDKTEHGMEKTVQNQGQSPKMSKSESILKNQQPICVQLTKTVKTLKARS
ncbi:putative reverse transcriptase domain-containing protein [Tanacetum coccineum]